MTGHSTQGGRWRKWTKFGIRAQVKRTSCLTTPHQCWPIPSDSQGAELTQELAGGLKELSNSFLAKFILFLKAGTSVKEQEQVTGLGRGGTWVHEEVEPIAFTLSFLQRAQFLQHPQGSQGEDWTASRPPSLRLDPQGNDCSRFLHRPGVFTWMADQTGGSLRLEVVLRMLWRAALT